MNKEGTSSFSGRPRLRLYRGAKGHAYSSSRPLDSVTFAPEVRIAQWILLPFRKTGGVVSQQERGNHGPGPSDRAHWIQTVGSERPERELPSDGKKRNGLLDTGADVSVISQRYWPSRWPVQPAMTSSPGIGQTPSIHPSALQSTQVLTRRDAGGGGGGKPGAFQPYVLPFLPRHLWGRDVLKNMGVFLSSPNPKAASSSYVRPGLHAGRGRDRAKTARG